MTPSQEKFLIHWHIYHDVWGGRKNNQATIKKMLADGWLYEHDAHLLVSRKGKEWCDSNHMRFLTGFGCEPRKIA